MTLTTSTMARKVLPRGMEILPKVFPAHTRASTTQEKNSPLPIPHSSRKGRVPMAMLPTLNSS